MHCCSGYRSLRRLYKRDWRNETVASSRNVGDESPPALTVAKGAAQSADLNLQIPFFHERLLPNSGYEFLFADNLAGAFDQSRQDVKRAVAEPRGRIALEQEPLRYKEPKRAKRDRASIHGAVHTPFPDFTQFYLTGQRQRCGREVATPKGDRSRHNTATSRRSSSLSRVLQSPGRSADAPPDQWMAALACQCGRLPRRTERGSRAPPRPLGSASFDRNAAMTSRIPLGRVFHATLRADEGIDLRPLGKLNFTSLYLI
jgi:hypothetical protein